MPCWCVVPTCKSCYLHHREHLHFFRVPKNDELFKKWEEVIPGARNFLKKSHRVCSRHFEEKFIKRCWVSGAGENKVEIPYQRPRLSENAVPSIFEAKKNICELLDECSTSDVEEELVVDWVCNDEPDLKNPMYELPFQEHTGSNNEIQKEYPKEIFEGHSPTIECCISTREVQEQSFDASSIPQMKSTSNKLSVKKSFTSNKTTEYSEENPT